MGEKYQMKLRQATEEDLEGIVLLENVLFDNAYGVGTIRKEIEAGYCAVLVDGDEVVGFALVRPSGELHDLMRLGVMPGRQRRGLGCWLLLHVLEMFPGPMMLMVRKNNDYAYKLYEKNGFRIIATTDSSWVMQRLTSSAS